MCIWRNTEARSRIIVAVEKHHVLHICVCVWVCMRVRACCHAHPAGTTYAPYYGVICGPSGSITFFYIIQ
jgi:hypothetical protein